MLRSSRAVLIAAVAAPPVGLVLMWLRPGAIWRKLVGSALIGVWSVAYLVLFFGMRFKLDGSGMLPHPIFENKEAHYAELERSRAQQAAPAVVEVAARPQDPAPEQPVQKPAPKPASVYWTDFRGKARDGHYDQTPMAVWPPKGLPVVWRQPIGGGYASFVIANGKAFTIEQRRRQEVVAAYDMGSGRELWNHGWDAEFKESMGGDGPRATPTWHEGRVYALGAAGELRCLDAETGKRIWSHNILTDNQAENLQWGMAASPLIVDDKVIVLPGGASGKSVVAYNKLTGEPVWKSLNDKEAYTSPMLVTLAGKKQILVVSQSRMMGLAPEDGSLLWEYPWVTEYDTNSAQPILLSQNRVFISAGYGHGSAVVQLSSAGDKFQAKEIWANNRMKNRFSSSVLYKGNVYGFDEGIFGCIDAETGQLKWKGGRYGHGQVLLVGDYLVVTTEDGELALLKPNPDRLEELRRFQAVKGQTWNHPAMSDGLLLVRNANEMACFRIHSM